MPKALAIAGLVVSVILFLLFAADLATGYPFSSHLPSGRASWTMDIGFVICALLLGVMSWFTYKEQT